MARVARAGHGRCAVMPMMELSGGKWAGAKANHGLKEMSRLGCMFERENIEDCQDSTSLYRVLPWLLLHAGRAFFS